MTDTRTWAAAEPSASSVDAPTYGAGEIAYALSLAEGPVRAQAEKFLQVEPGFVTDQTAALGASSLVARGELTVTGDLLEPRGGIRLLIVVLQTAVRWTEIAMMNEGSVEAALYVQSPELSVLLSPAAMSTWTMVVRSPAYTDAQFLARLVNDNAARHPLGTAYFGTEVLGSEKHHLFVRPSSEVDTFGGRTWDLADAEAPGDGRSDAVGDAELLERLAAFSALPSA
ncbi:hypothetical protein [Herbiconiux liangxiaofengii]|uniref:hypothetical protein n=1 Tax=Herbiconiux liangxiaofengii TaxID=3342795 RepID=UPI0035BB2E28